MTERALLALAACCGLALTLTAQEAPSPYVPDPDPLVRQKIDEWQDLKLGLLMHWGPYAQWGIVESWSLCAEDEPWCKRSMDDYAAYKSAYEKLQTTFNPVRFEPERWAKAAADAGMRYVVFTTKHHDGFSMFDTRQTDYRITSPLTPFSKDPRADVTKGIFEAFRARGFKIGAYFSKPDWHSPDYWWPYFATPDRNPNYDVKKYPERWQRFVAFTHAQIDELMSRYGRVDILWLDGGWVRPRTDAEIRATITSPDYKFARVQSQDIDMPRLVAAARAKQPGLIVVDRDVPGPYQNYLTPEARVPPQVLPYPWEVPMPMARSWSYVPNDVYKTPRVLIQMLVDVVAKGGNLLLNIGPGPDGTWHDAAYDRLAALGVWMKINSEAIYGTRPVAPYADGQMRFTRAKDGTVYVIYLPRDGETALPREVTVANFAPAPGATITLVGTGRAIPWDLSGAGFVMHLPAGLTPPNADAWVFRVSRPPQDIPPERRAAREWFRDAKFGMFVHWGVYSQLAQGEWVMQNRSLPVSTYEWLASSFNPIKFDAREWVSLAKAAGVRYITITSRHHDGFSMFATKATRYNIVDWTPYKRDPLKALADECHRQGVKLFFYYSQLDWHHPDFWPRGNTGKATGRPDAGEWPRYLDFMDAQLTELLTNYGPIGGIWFDGMWDKPDADWRLDRTYALIHRLQPSALIVPNHHKAPLPGEDVQTFEQDLPGANTAGFNTKEIGALPLETSLTMNGAWGFNITDRNFKSVPDLIGYLVRAAGQGGNLLLNVGPRPDGTIQPEAVDRLRDIGRWLQTYGASIYGTRAGPVPPQKWGATTRRGDTVYVHVLDGSIATLSLPDPGRVKSARLLGRTGEVAITATGAGLTLTLPPHLPDEVDRVVVLEIER